MAEILSQDEVNALLQAVDDGDLPAGAGATGEGPRAVRTIDLTNLPWTVEGRLPGLKPVVDRFARGLRTSLATFVGQLPNVTVRATHIVKYTAVLERLPQPAGLQIFRMAPLRGHGMLVVSPSLLASLLQVFFGGSPNRRTPLPAREFSPIELRVIERLGTRVLAELREAWVGVETLDVSPVRIETNPRFAAIAGAQDPVLVSEFGVEFEGCDDGSLAVYLPNAMLDPLRGRLQVTANADEAPPDAAWSERLRGALAEATVEISAELGSHRMTMREVLGLAVGDVVSLGTGREGPVLVRVAGRPRFQAAPGVAGGHNAVRVTGTL
jgi:flagellar motor switch protein FliM